MNHWYNNNELYYRVLLLLNESHTDEVSDKINDSIKDGNLETEGC